MKTVPPLSLKGFCKGKHFENTSTGLRAGIDRLLPRNVPLLGGSLVISFKKGIGILNQQEKSR